LKKRVIEPLIVALENHALSCEENKRGIPSARIRYASVRVYEITKKFDMELFCDLLEAHYPSLKELWLEYCELFRKSSEGESRYKEKFSSEVIGYLKSKNLPYIEKYDSKVTNHYFAQYLIDTLRGFFERVMDFPEAKEKILAEEIESVKKELGRGLWLVTYHGAPIIYITNSEKMAEKSRGEVINLIKLVMKNESISKLFKECKTLKDRLYKKGEELKKALGDLNRKVVFNFEKKWKIIVKCPYVKEKIE